MEYSGTFERLKYYVEQESHSENEEHKLIEDYVRNKKLLAYLEKKHKDDIEEQKRKSLELDSEIHELENDINVSMNLFFSSKLIFRFILIQLAFLRI